MAIIEQRSIKNIEDIFNLDFINYRPPTGDLKSTYKLIEAIASWFNSEKHGVSIVATATTVNLDDYSKAPIRNDFPKWEHIGGHVSMAHKYWNWFKFNS